MIKNYFKTAWRSLWKHKQTTLINITGLTIGMAAAVLITLWVQNEVSYDNYHPGGENIYRIKTDVKISKTESWIWESSQYNIGEFAKKQIPEIENVTRVQPISSRTKLIIHNDEKLTAEDKGAYVDDQWFNFFHYDFVEGGAPSFAHNPSAMILTESAARKYFGKSEALGRILRIDTVNYQVKAIVKDNPANSSFQFDVIMPISSLMANAEYKRQVTQWGNYQFQTFFKLKPKSNLSNIAQTLGIILHKNQKTSNASYQLIKLGDIHFESDLQSSSLDHGNRSTVKIFSVLALLLILTACINYVNLTTARASIRAKEVSVRKIVGAGRGQLFGQFMAESFLISLISLILAMAIIQLSLPVFNSITDKHFVNPLAAVTTWRIISGTLLLSFILNGIYPAVLLSSFKPMSVFRGKSLTAFRDTSLRKGLVVIQFAISVVLIIGTIVIYRQLNFMEKTDLGYDKSHIFTFSVDYWRIPGFDFKKSEAFLSSIRKELDQETAFAGVAQANEPIVNFTSSSAGSFDWAGRPKDFNPAVAPFAADTGFAKMMQLKMTDGHWFTAADNHNVILNETAVREFNMPKPIIGQRFYHQGDTGVVIGIVKDFHYRNLHQKIGSMVIRHDSAPITFYLKTKPGYDAEAVTAAGRVWQKFVPSEPFDFSFLDDDYNRLYLKEQKLSLLISFFAGIAILVSALGLLGLAAFAAEQKVKEIGIRKILGASIQHIVGILSADFVKMVVIASVISFPLAWWAMNKWLMDFAYKVDISWWIFLLAGGLALAIAMVTVSIEAIKAAMVNPVKSLRSE